jgi:hypothetical protein
MNFQDMEEFYSWFYNNLFDGPLCVKVQHSVVRIGHPEDNGVSEWKN